MYGLLGIIQSFKKIVEQLVIGIKFKNSVLNFGLKEMKRCVQKVLTGAS